MRAATTTLARLIAHREHLGATVVAALETTVQDVERRLRRDELCVVVVAEQHAGKRTFLDALLGDRLLGSAKRHPDAVLFLRRAPSPSYRAQFSNGRVEDFAIRCPDGSADLEEKVGAAMAREAEAAAPHAHAERVVAETTATLARAEADVRRAHTAFERARDEASRLGEAVGAAQSEARRQEAVVAEGERNLPSIARTRPPWWAVWLWIVRAIVLLAAGRAFRAHAERVVLLEAAQSRAASLRREASHAAQACREAEAALGTTATPVEEARRALGEAQRELASARVRLDERRAEVAAARRAVERHSAERAATFFEDVRALTDPTSRGKGLVTLEIEYPARHLPQDVALLDAPAATSDSEQARERAWNVIREHADGCILISELQRAVSGATRTFLQRVREIVPHVILVLTKMDEAFMSALRKGEGEPWQHVEQARRIGTRRFAREIGREPASVLSLAMAAEPALRGGTSAGLATRFEADAAKLFQLLRHERALILGARSAEIVRRSIASVGEAEGRAEAAYRARIADLEARRLPEPATFCAEQLQTAAAPLRDGARQAVESALELLAEGIGAICEASRARIDACSSRAELEGVVPQLERSIADALKRTERDVWAHLESRVEALVRDLEGRAFDAIRRRYELTHQITGKSTPAPRFDGRDAELSSIELGKEVETSLRSLARFRIGLGAGGATAGALVGTAIMPGVGTAVGAAVGVLLALASPLGRVKDRLAKHVATIIRSVETNVATRIRSEERAVHAEIEAHLDASIRDAVVRFARWIAEPLEAAREAIERAHAGLRDLQALHQRLEQHDATLQLLKKAATDASVGLCR